MLLQAAPHQQIELLVGSAELDIGFQRDRVVALDQRIEELVDRDRLLGRVALGEIVALEHARNSVLAGQLDHVGSAHLAEPLGIESHLGALAIEHLEDLIGVGRRVGRDVLGRQRLARDVLAGRVADHSGEVADQENDLMAEILELTHLVEQHGVADMQVRRRRIEAGLDAQRPTRA